MAAAFLAAVLGGIMASAAARSEPVSAFLAYLSSSSPPASLIAFNPSGFDPRQPLPAEGYPGAEIRADLAALRPGFDGLVLYAYQPGLTPAIVGIAAELGYRAILLGIWDPRSSVERDGIVELVSRHNDRIAFAVVIGNEGINDNRYDLADLRAAHDDLARRLPPGVRVPVTTSEPAGDYGWVPLREFGDFLAPNIHPALDRGDLTPDAAAMWVRRKAIAIAGAAGKPVLVKETGVPRGGAPGFGPERQRAFWVAYTRPGLATITVPAGGTVSFAAAFEAFDAAWKADVLGSPVEGHWGLLAGDRTPYPAFRVWSALRAGR